MPGGVCASRCYGVYFGGGALGLGLDDRSFLPGCGGRWQSEQRAVGGGSNDGFAAVAPASGWTSCTQFTMHSFCVGGSLTQSLGGTAVDEIMKIAGWKTQSVAERYIGPTTSDAVAASDRQRSRGYGDSN